jgi:hypothetical protein
MAVPTKKPKTPGQPQPVAPTPAPTSAAPAVAAPPPGEAPVNTWDRIGFLVWVGCALVLVGLHFKDLFGMLLRLLGLSGSGDRAGRPSPARWAGGGATASPLQPRPPGVG